MAQPGRFLDWRTWQLVVASLVAFVVGLGVGAAAVSGSDESDDGASAPETRDRGEDDRGDETSRRTTTTTLPRTTTTAAAADEGTRENPFPLGAPLRSDDGWELTINRVDFDAASEIAATNQLNDPAPPGLRYVLVNATYTNNTSEPGNPAFEVSIETIGSQNRLWGAGNASCFAVIPEPVTSASHPPGGRPSTT